MTKLALALAACVTVGIWVASCCAIGQINSNVSSADQQGQDLTTGWSLLKEGEAEGNIEPDAKRLADPDTTFLHIIVTKTAPPGQGRVGAINHMPVNVDEGKWYDATFRAFAEGRSVGIVFSLEGPDGKVLARTTLPEIGRMRRGGAGNDVEANPAPRKYNVALHARASDSHAHLTLSPIEPTSVWIESIKLTPRSNIP
jgi:hypothetical protein